MNTFKALTFVLLVASIPYSYADDDDDSTETDDDSANQMYDKVSKYRNCRIWYYIGASQTTGLSSVVRLGCLRQREAFKRSFKQYSCQFIKSKVKTYCNAVSTTFGQYYATVCQFAKDASSLCKPVTNYMCTFQLQWMSILRLSCDDYEEDCTQYSKPLFGCRFSRRNKRCTCQKYQKLLSCCKTRTPPATTQAPEPTTAAATTQAPTTQAPTTAAPTTQAPTTAAPTTQAPTTAAPTTQAPTTAAPTTQAPTTAAPTTQAPTTAAPTTQAPTTAAPTTQAPTTAAPTTQAPTTAAPTTQAPTTAAPTTQAPTTAAPTTQAPTTAAPTTQAPTTAAPTTQAPTTQAPTTASSLPISIVPGFLDGSGCGALCVRNDAVDTECQTAPTGPCNYEGELAGQYSCCEP